MLILGHFKPAGIRGRPSLCSSGASLMQKALLHLCWSQTARVPEGMPAGRPGNTTRQSPDCELLSPLKVCKSHPLPHEGPLSPRSTGCKDIPGGRAWAPRESNHFRSRYCSQTHSDGPPSPPGSSLSSDVPSTALFVTPRTLSL